jgi:choline dehydrogenase-like flavoprotein
MKKSVCVIGAGLAGGVVASSLAARGHLVTLLELGDAAAPLLPTNEVWEDRKLLGAFTRGSGFGGTSNFWHGGLTVLDRSDIEGPSGERRLLPITYDRLRDYYAKALAVLHANEALSLTDIEAPPDTPVDAFGSTGDVFKLKAVLYPNKPFSSQRLIGQAKEMHGLRVVPNIEVKQFVNAGSRRIRLAEGIDLKAGRLRSFHADAFVLCAGGLGSPKILLQSVKACAKLAGLPIGHFIIDHPSGFVLKGRLRRRLNLAPLFGAAKGGHRLQYGFVLSPSRLGDAERRNHILYLRPATSMKDPAAYDFLKRKLVAYKGKALVPRDLFYLARHTDLLFDVINFKYGLSYSTRHVSGLVFAEQLPNERMYMHQLDNGNFGIRWQVSSEDCHSLEKFLEIFREQFSEQFEEFRILPNMGDRLESAGHHSGGCRMGADASTAVVDADLRVHGFDNLHVVDGSVIAYSGHANTGLTIAALALQCSDAVSNT